MHCIGIELYIFFSIQVPLSIFFSWYFRTMIIKLKCNLLVVCVCERVRVRSVKGYVCVGCWWWVRVVLMRHACAAAWWGADGCAWIADEECVCFAACKVYGLHNFFLKNSDFIEFKNCNKMKQVATALFANSPFTKEKPNGFLSMRRFFYSLPWNYFPCMSQDICFLLTSLLCFSFVFSFLFPPSSLSSLLSFFCFLLSLLNNLARIHETAFYHKARSILEYESYKDIVTNIIKLKIQQWWVKW